MRARLRLLTLFLIVLCTLAMNDVLAVPPGEDCLVDADCVDPCRHGGDCNPITGHCTYDGPEPDGMSCTSDGNGTTNDYCQGGQCTHVTNCWAMPSDYCEDTFGGGGCVQSECVNMQIVPHSPLTFYSGRCFTTTTSNGFGPLWQSGEEPPRGVCQAGWVCQSGAPIPTSYSFQQQRGCSWTTRRSAESPSATGSSPIAAAPTAS